MPTDGQRAASSFGIPPSEERLAESFLAGDLDLLLMVSTRYLSAGSQAVQTVQLLPLPDPDAVDADKGADADEDAGTLEGYTEFEPDPARLLAVLAPRAVESEVFSALLEGAASFFT
ncbi:MAG: F0F1 ATP synthase subunit gamma, partial [Myxococcaceae bacterium]